MTLCKCPELKPKHQETMNSQLNIMTNHQLQLKYANILTGILKSISCVYLDVRERCSNRFGLKTITRYLDILLVKSHSAFRLFDDGHGERLKIQ